MPVRISRTDSRRPITPEEREATIARLHAGSAKLDCGCIVWQRTKNTLGYGVMSFQNQAWMTHRLSWLLRNGPIPGGMFVCHRCDTPACINHEHLFLGDHTENQRDMVKKRRHYKVVLTHCLRGHPLSGGNIYLDHGKRKCKRCQIIRARIRMGWPKDLAESLPSVRKGKRPVGAQWLRKITSHDAGVSPDA